MSTPREIWIVLHEGGHTFSAFGSDPKHIHDDGRPVYRYVLASVPTARERLLAGALLGHEHISEALAEARAILAPEPTDEI